MSTAIGSKRPGSPQSPTRYSTLQKMKDLQNLNNRLACYIDKVRHLKAENSRLKRQVHTMKETTTRVIFNEKSILKKKTEDLQIAERNLSLYVARINDLKSKLTQNQTTREKITDKNRELENENERLNAALNDTRHHLEEETLQRVRFIYHIQGSVSKKIKFMNRNLPKCVRGDRYVEISEIDGRLAEQYEAKLQQSLQELRDQYEAQMRANREEIAMLYENKIKNLTSHAQCKSDAASTTIKELRQMRPGIDILKQRINEFEASINALNARIRY
ncbi:hypothetical protein M0804_013909 [Polistes exclamans]|nr:hypothetical protein M0804_013909 [Polistes exclamans]